jgi:hypothetical protein
MDLEPGLEPGLQLGLELDLAGVRILVCTSERAGTVRKVAGQATIRSTVKFWG